ncbi:MAG: sulfatase-like hydrolase/transferase [Candidatus Eisenbacteria bacterium]|nr:sulfatase-like hydrolase/transferase [Candidatus Eisenbacteria bacterium]
MTGNRPIAEAPGPSAPLGRALFGLALAGLALVLSSCAGTERPEGEPRHVIFISIDTARADAFGFMGSADASTPRLDELAEESVVFTDYMTVVPTTLASHTTLLTGKHPHSHGTPRNGFMVNRENEMLPEILKREGFHTAGFAGSFALDRRFDFAQGFDHYDQEFEILVGDSGADQNQRLAEDVTDAVLSYLDGLGTKERLFLFAHYFDPHRPYAAPAPFDTIHDGRGREGLVPIPELVRMAVVEPELASREARRHVAQYASEISYTDEHVGRLLDGLRTRGILDEALLVVTSDHGESLWEHEEFFDHGRTVHQSTMHSLCLFRLPGGESGGSRTDEPAANIDIVPTVLSLLGIDLPAETDGIAVEFKDDEELPRDRPRFGQATKPWRGVETDITWHNMLKSRCIRKGPYKLVQTPYLGTEELYDLRSDPSETLDLLGTGEREAHSVAAGLRPVLVEWARSADPLESWFESSQKRETIERLRSLGYLQ